MKKFSTYLIVMFIIVFWILRIIITLAAQFGGSFLGVVPTNETMEILVLFATLISILLICKRKIIGSIFYLIIQTAYFGMDLVLGINVITNQSLSATQSVEIIFGLVGMILPILALIDTLLDKNRKINPKNSKTDWFYKNEQYDRDTDGREDKNNYRIM